MKVRGGFSLLELLVCIAIIAVLVSIALPALNAAEQMAGSLQCLAGVRQLGLLTRMYIDEHDQRFPQPIEDEQLAAKKGPDVAAAALWFNALDPYLGLRRLKYHPSDPAHRHNVAAKQDAGVWRGFSPSSRIVNRTLKMNAYFGDTVNGGYRFYHPREVTHPGRTLLFVDGRARDITGQDGLSAALFRATAGIVALRHRGAANVAFADGHAALVRRAVNPALQFPGWYGDSPVDPALIWNFHLGGR